MKTLRETKVGKSTLRLVKTSAGYSGLVIRDGKVNARIDGSDPDQLWLQLHDEVGKGNPNYFGYDGARNRFERIFPGGFSSSSYIQHERKYKVAAKQRLDAEVPLEAARQGSGLGEPILKIFQATNLLSPFEKMRVQDALRSPDADRFIRGAATFAIGDMQSGLHEMEASLKPHDAAKWTTVTYLPFLWRPESHMFLKPEVTKEFANRVGHRFAYEYTPKLEQATYSSLLDLVSTLEREVVKLKPVDRIDLQSFIWVVGEYTAEDKACAPR
jgi:hypothetical protein